MKHIHTTSTKTFFSCVTKHQRWEVTKYKSLTCTSLPSTGIALLYLHLHEVFGDSSFLQRALEHVSRSLKCLTRRHDVTFLCGDGGPLAVAAVVYHRLQRAPEAQECVSR